LLLILLAAEIASAAKVSSPSSQDWDWIVRRAEEKGQVAIICHRLDWQRADDLGRFSKALLEKSTSHRPRISSASCAKESKTMPQLPAYKNAPRYRAAFSAWCWRKDLLSPERL
jgi:hypothetical protein